MWVTIGHGVLLNRGCRVLKLPGSEPQREALFSSTCSLLALLAGTLYNKLLVEICQMTGAD